MPTLSFHAPAAASRKIRAAARQRRIPVSRFLRAAAEAAATGSPISGLGRELERLAIDGMAVMALSRTQARAKSTGLDRLTDAEITAEIKAHRRERRGGA